MSHSFERSGTVPADHPLMSSFLGVPVLVRNEVAANLYFSEKVGGGEFSDVDEELAVAVAAVAASAIDNVRLTQRENAMALLAERERIGRDLHEDVVQRLFAAGFALQAIAALSAEPHIVARVGQVVDDLDATIRQVRSTIFQLSDRSEPGSLRATVIEVCNAATTALGFDPSCEIRGPVDSSVSESIADQLVISLREALANVARHASASRVDVVVVVRDARITLEVIDDGVGLGRRDLLRGNGLKNLDDRANELGGTFDVASPEGGGTTLIWASPLPIINLAKSARKLDTERSFRP